MAEIDLLLEEIARDPADDAPRWRAAIVYDQLGNRDRGRFIRLQLQVAALSAGVDSPEWLPMIEESESLLETHYDEWKAPYDSLHIIEPQYDRGFIELVGLEGETLLIDEYRAEILRRLPIKHVDVFIADLRKTPPVQILRLRELHEMVSVGLDRMGLGDRDLEEIAAHKWPRLRWLSLTGNELSERGVFQFTDTWRESMPLLEFIELEGNQYDPYNEIEYDQDVALAWRRDGPEMEALVNRAPWLRPRIVYGKVESYDRLALARPNPRRVAR
jgi:hypothetical protein